MRSEVREGGWIEVSWGWSRLVGLLIYAARLGPPVNVDMQGI